MEGGVKPAAGASIQCIHNLMVKKDAEQHFSIAGSEKTAHSLSGQGAVIGRAHGAVWEALHGQGGCLSSKCVRWAKKHRNICLAGSKPSREQGVGTGGQMALENGMVNVVYFYKLRIFKKNVTKTENPISLFSFRHVRKDRGLLGIFGNMLSDFPISN